MELLVIFSLYFCTMQKQNQKKNTKKNLAENKQQEQDIVRN